MKHPFLNTAVAANDVPAYSVKGITYFDLFAASADIGQGVTGIDIAEINKG